MAPTEENRPGVEDGFDAEPLQQPWIAVAIEVVPPFERDVVGRQDGMHMADEGAAVVECGLVADGKKRFVPRAQRGESGIEIGVHGGCG